MNRAAVLLLLIALAGAQSYFNAQGLGEISPVPEADVAAAGGALALSSTNPGMLVTLDRVEFSLSVRGGITAGSTAGGTRALIVAAPSGFAVAVPLPAGLRLVGSVSERFNQDFDIWSESLPDTAYRRHVVGRGGIYSLQAGLSKSLFNRVCVGAAYNHLLGGSREEWRFEVETGGYTAVDTIEVDFSGSAFVAGLSYQDRRLTLSTLFQSPVSLRADRYRLVHGVIADSQRTASVSLPYSVHFGAAVAPSSRLQVSAGFSWRPWSSAAITTNEQPRAPAGFQDVWRGSLGAEYELTEGLTIRTGVAHQGWYYRPVLSGQPQRIDENNLTLGTGLPVPNLGRLDLAVRAGLRSCKGLNEVTAGISLTTAYREPWTRRTRRWGY